MRKDEKAVLDYFNDGSKKRIAFRMQDMADANMAIWREPSLRGRVTMDKNPSDFIITENGETYYAEAKSTIDMRGITSGLFKTQVAPRTRILTANGSYFYFIYSYTFLRWYKVPAQFIVENPNRKWEELARYEIYYLPKIYR